MQNAHKILDKLLDYYKITTDKELAIRLDISIDKMYSWRKRNRVDIQEILPIIIKEKIDLNWLLGNVLENKDIVRTFAVKENEIAYNRIQIFELADELNQFKSQVNKDDSQIATLLDKIEKLMIDKIKAEAERDILLDIVKGKMK